MKKMVYWNLYIYDEHLINISNYFLQLEQSRKYFPLENILILDFDKLRINPVLLLHRIHKFLGLSYEFFPKEYKIRNIIQIESSFEKKFRDLKLYRFSLTYIPKALKGIGKILLRRVNPSENRTLTDVEKELV